MKLSVTLLVLINSVHSLNIPEYAEFEKGLLNDKLTLELKKAELKKCPVDIPFTCTDEKYDGDTCCFENPGGVLLQTQFWDYYPPIGPDDMFTLHGLWSDKCDGSFEQFCDSSMEIDNVRDILKEHKEYELLEKMENVWKNYNGDDESLWKHEFNKHGTCMSTIKEKCYEGEYKKNQNVVDFFKKSVELFERLPTYKWLSDNGIIPSNEQTYSKQQIEDTLSAHFGQPVYIKCNRYQALQEVWYFYHLRGSVINGEYMPIPAMVNSQCPNEGIKFIPKRGFKPPTPPPGPNPPGKPKDGIKGYLKLENEPGCVISNGNWYTSGSCATFTLQKAEFGGYNIKSSKGYCKVSDTDGTFTCGPNVKPMQFSYNKDKDKQWISFGGESKWNADKVPGRFQQGGIRPGIDGEVVFHLYLS